jgi:hypothetical protein
VGDLLHAEDRRARHLELAQDVDGLVLGLVRQPAFDYIEDVRFTSLGGVVRRIVDPPGPVDGFAAVKSMTLIPVSGKLVMVGFPVQGL